jgi:hypothetical protein
MRVKPVGFSIRYSFCLFQFSHIIFMNVQYQGPNRQISYWEGGDLIWIDLKQKGRK